MKRPEIEYATADFRQVSMVPEGFVRRFRLRLRTVSAVWEGRGRSLERVRRLSFRRTLVLCHGNIYRSPLTAAFLRRSFPEFEGVEVRSAGFHPKAGRASPSDFIQHVRDRFRIDITAHRSRLISSDDVQWADSIVIMDRHNWHALARLEPSCIFKVIWLGAFLPSGPLEIADPYGRPDRDVKRIVEHLSLGATALVERVRDARLTANHATQS